MMRRCAVVVGLLLLGAAMALADAVSIPLSGAGVMTSPTGKVRVLLSAPNLPSFENRAISDARLRLHLPVAASLDRTLRLEVWPVSSPWSPGVVSWTAWDNPGGDFHRAWRGHMELTAGESRSELTVDVTNVLRAVAGGAEFYGFLFAVPSAYGEGFDSDHATLLQAALGSARLDITSHRAKRPAERGF